MKYIMQLQYENSKKMYKEYGIDMENNDEVKNILLDANFYLMVITVIVALFHNVFEFLAMKSGIYDRFFKYYFYYFKLSNKIIKLN